MTLDECIWPKPLEVECKGKIDAELLKLLRGRKPFEAAGYDKSGAWYWFEHALCTRYSVEHSTGDLHYTLLEVRMVEKPKPVPCKPSTWIGVRTCELQDEFRRKWPGAPMPNVSQFQVKAVIECLDRLGVTLEPR